MNFYGHAVVASWSSRDPRVLLGAMLPDFAGMARARLAGSKDEAIARGIALHHATDEVFHGAQLFLQIYSEGIDALEGEGVGRGTARAVAHVGTELLLDGLLLDRAAIDSSYLEAIAIAKDAEIAWREGAERFLALHDRLAGHGLPREYQSAGGVALRLGQALSRRPRLAITDADRAPVAAWLEASRARVEERMDALLGEVREGLSQGPPSR